MSIKRLLTRVFRAEPTKILAGRDLDGNCYYEIPPQQYYFGMIKHEKAKRTVETPPSVLPPDHDPRDIYVPKVPREWQLWLRFTRDTPPTVEELQENIHRAQEAARNLVAHQRKEDREMKMKRQMDEMKAQREKAKRKPVSKDEIEQSQTVESWSGFSK